MESLTRFIVPMRRVASVHTVCHVSHGPLFDSLPDRAFTAHATAALMRVCVCVSFWTGGPKWVVSFWFPFLPPQSKGILKKQPRPSAKAPQSCDFKAWVFKDKFMAHLRGEQMHSDSNALLERFQTYFTQHLQGACSIPLPGSPFHPPPEGQRGGSWSSTWKHNICTQSYIAPTRFQESLRDL